MIPNTRVLACALIIPAAAATALQPTVPSPTQPLAPAPVFIDRIVQVSVAPQQHAQMQSLYHAAHQSYTLGDLEDADRAFAALAAAAPGSFLEVDARRMQAQLSMAQGHQAADAALHHYRLALAALDAMEDPEPIDVEAALISFGTMMGLLAESVGDLDLAFDISSRMLDIGSLHTTARIQALLRLGRIELARGNNDAAKRSFQRYLDEYPQSGWNDGTRIEVLRSIEVADGMQWNGSTPREIRFCAGILADPAFRQDDARYNLGVHMASSLLRTGRDAEVEPLINSLLDEIANDLRAAEEAAAETGRSERRAWLKEHAEGTLRHTLIFALVSMNRHQEALEQVYILSSSPDFGGYSNATPERYGLEDLRQP